MIKIEKRGDKYYIIYQPDELSIIRKSGTHVLCKSCMTLCKIPDTLFEISYYISNISQPYQCEIKCLSCLRRLPPLEALCFIHELTLEEKQILAI